MSTPNSYRPLTGVLLGIGVSLTVGTSNLGIGIRVGLAIIFG